MSAFVRDSGGDLSLFKEPPWDAPLDVERELECIPPTSLIRGMFIQPVVNEAKRAQRGTLNTRDRYVPFQFYPLREHARLLAETAALVFPKLSMRQALRKLGRGAPHAFLNSRLGRVVLQPGLDVFEIVMGFAKGYELCLSPGRASVEQRAERVLDVTLEDLHYYLDSHHVGAFEGTLRMANLQGHVQIHRISAAQAVLRLEW